MADRQSVKINITFQPKEQVKQQLDTILQYLNKNSKIELNLDTAKATKSLGEFSNLLNNIGGEINKSFQSNGIDSVSNKINNTTEKTKEATNVVQEYKESLGIAGVTKGYDELQARLEQLKGSMTELSKVNIKSDEMGNINSAVLTYKDNLGNIVTETMAWQQKSTDAENEITNVFKTVGVNVTDNIE